MHYLGQLFGQVPQLVECSGSDKALIPGMTAFIRHPHHSTRIHCLSNNVGEDMVIISIDRETSTLNTGETIFYGTWQEFVDVLKNYSDSVFQTDVPVAQNESSEIHSYEQSSLL